VALRSGRVAVGRVICRALLSLLYHPSRSTSFAQLVEIANGVAVAIGIKKSLHCRSQDSAFFDGRLILVAVQALQIISGSRAVFMCHPKLNTWLSI
jgi:hypothetical protein